MGEWSNLTQREKSNIIRFAIKNGVSDINQIRDTFNVYARDGHIHEGTKSDSKLHIPTREEYITQKLDSIQNAALEASRRKTQAQTTPAYARDVYGQKYVTDVLLKGYVEDARNQVARLKAQERFRTKKNNSPEFIQGNTNTAYQSVRLAEAEKSLETAEKMLSGEIKYDGPTLNNCIANLSEFFPHGLPYGNETFSNNPKKYGFSLIDTWDVKPGDLVQKVDYRGRVPVPHHAMIYNGVDSNGEPTFNYSNGSMPYTIPNEFTGKVDTVGGYGVGKYYPDAVAKDKEHLWDVNVYRYTGTPQDSAMWTNEWLQKYGTGAEFSSGGKIHIAPSKRGTFTAAASKHGKSVQAFARQVLANKENYSTAMVRKAVFAHNSAKWHKHDGLSDTQYLSTDAIQNYAPSIIEGVVVPKDMRLSETQLAELQNKKRLYSNEGLEIVSPEFDVLAGIRGIMTLPRNAFGISSKELMRGNKDLAYRVTSENMIEDAARTGIIRTPNTAGLNPRYKFDIPYFYKGRPYYTPNRPLRGTGWTAPNNVREAVIVGGKGTEFIQVEPLTGKFIPGTNNALSAQPIYTEITPYKIPGKIDDFIYYQQNTLGRYVPRTFYEPIDVRDREILQSLTKIVSTPAVAEGLQQISREYSTGGPLYLFSFQKNPYWKTPVVRYDEGGKIRNWDTTLTGKLINYVENSDSIGWSPVDRTWEPPTLPGYDKNQIGMGVDKNKTPGYWDYIQYRPKTNVPFLTELDERLIRHNAIEAANKSANERYKFAQEAVNRPKGTVSPVKDAAVVSAIYNLGAGYVANGLFEDKDFMLKLFDGTDKEVVDRINQEYKKKGRNERIAKTNLFLFQK